MKKNNRMNASNTATGIIFLLVGLVAAYLYFSGILEHTIMNLAIAIVPICFGIADIFTHLAKTVYLTEEGIEICRFGKSIRSVAWHEIAQISIVRNQRGSAGSGNAPMILFTPVGCEKYDSSQTGMEYREAFEPDVIPVAYSAKTKQFIQQYCGQEIEDFAYSSSK